MNRRRTAAFAVAIAVALGAVTAGAAMLRLGPFAPVDAVPPRFIDETTSSGLTSTYDGPFEYAFGAGVAAFDCDDDGRSELYLAGGAGPAALFHNDSPVGGELRFSRVADPATDLDGLNGAYPIDIDGDGQVDLITLRSGENVALRGLGGCRFERANEAWGLDGGGQLTEAFSATWEPGATWPTLAFGNYIDFDPSGVAAGCQPNELVRPATTGVGFDTSIPLEPSFCALSMLFGDWNGTGRRDLRISNDRHYYDPALGEEQLWRIDPGVQPRLYDRADGWNRVQVEGMGIGTRDVTGDGIDEVYLTSQAANRLQRLSGDPTRPTYEDIGLEYGVNVAQPYTGDDIHLPSTAWHPEFADVNNDGRIDLFVSKGNVTTQPDYAIQDPSNILLGQADGTFREAGEAAGIVVFDRGRGAALVDLNLDGRLDLVESFYGAPVRVWRNAGLQGGNPGHDAHWLGIRLQQPGPNVDAIGAVVEMRIGEVASRREVTIGGGHGGGQLGWLHAGLGSATTAELRVRWPDGELGPWQTVDADRFLVLDRQTGGAIPWQPAGAGG